MSLLLASFACCVCAALVLALSRAVRRPEPRIPAGSGLRLVPRAIPAALAADAARFVRGALAAGRAGELPARVYAAPPPAMARRRQSRETLTYGVCVPPRARARKPLAAFRRRPRALGFSTRGEALSV